MDFPEEADSDDYLAGPEACKGAICMCTPVCHNALNEQCGPWGGHTGINAAGYTGETCCAPDHTCRGKQGNNNSFGYWWACKPTVYVPPAGGAGSGAGGGGGGRSR